MSDATTSQAGHGKPTRVTLIASLLLVLAVVTTLSLLTVRHRLLRNISTGLSDDLSLSVETFSNIEAQRLDELRRENALLANLPTLKAVMTTNDSTIRDASILFWQTSRNDLFALADKHGRVIAAYTLGTPADAALRTRLSQAVSIPGRHYLLTGNRLFEYSMRPLYLGDDETGTLIGYVISGDAIDERFVRQMGRASGVEVAYLSYRHVVISTLPALTQQSTLPLGTFPDLKAKSQTITLKGERFLLTGQDLSEVSAEPLQLMVLKSFDKAERAVGEIDRLVLFVGLFATGIGVVLMLFLSQALTRPLELLAKGVRAFGLGDTLHALPQNGPLEVRELSAAFAAMRNHIQRTNLDLLEAERLATIGRMAASVSHDLRHSLAVIYASSEILTYPRLSESERQEIFAEIGKAVNGTTDLLDSMLIFSRSGTAVQRSQALIAALLERTIALIRIHPDAQGVVLSAEYGEPTDTSAFVDVRQIERAIFNLLLNACQSRNEFGQTHTVLASLATTPDSLSLTVLDDGPGVPDDVRQSLFKPFVSEGKQKGTGLGLTLVNSIAVEHGGMAELLSTRPGETIFRMKIMRTSGSTVLEPAPIQSEVVIR
jgi:signal transduction histidine kinase